MTRCRAEIRTYYFPDEERMRYMLSHGRRLWHVMVLGYFPELPSPILELGARQLVDIYSNNISPFSTDFYVTVK